MELGQWVPASKLLIEKYLLDAGTFYIVPDINNDLVHDGSDPDDSLGVALDKSNLGNPEYLSVAPVNNGSTSESYALNNVKPGLYYLGGVIDLGTPGNFDNTEDWLGTFNDIDPFLDPPNTLVFSENTVFDFMLNMPTP